jgi:hypothetical protein
MRLLQTLNSGEGDRKRVDLNPSGDRDRSLWGTYEGRFKAHGGNHPCCPQDRDRRVPHFSLQVPSGSVREDRHHILHTILYIT